MPSCKSKVKDKLLHLLSEGRNHLQVWTITVGGIAYEIFHGSGSVREDQGDCRHWSKMQRVWRLAVLRAFWTSWIRPDSVSNIMRRRNAVVKSHDSTPMEWPQLSTSKDGGLGPGEAWRQLEKLSSCFPQCLSEPAKVPLDIQVTDLRKSVRWYCCLSQRSPLGHFAKPTPVIVELWSLSSRSNISGN